MIVTIALLLLLLVIGYYFHQKHVTFAFFKKRGIPGPEPVFLIGNMLDNLRIKCSIYVRKQRRDKYGDLYGEFEGSRPKLIISNPDDLRNIFVKEFAYFTDIRSDGYDHPIEQKFILVLGGDVWHYWRRILSPTFTPQKMRAMLPLIDNSIENLMQHIDRKSMTEEYPDIKRIFMNFSFEVMVNIGMGVKMNLHEKTDPFAEAMQNYFQTNPYKLLISLMLPKWLKTRARFTVMNKKQLEFAINFIQSVIDERRKLADPKMGRPFEDFTSIIMKATGDGNRLKVTDEHMIANILFMLMAGDEASAMVLTFVTHLLAFHPKIQQRLHEEISRAVHESEEKKLDFETVKNIQFLEAVINETMRLYPPSTYIERKVSQKYDLHGIDLPVGLHILVPTILIQRDEKWHKNAISFDPDRFMPGRIEDMHPFSFLPLGHGPRTCVGARFVMMEMKITLARLVQTYEFQIRDGAKEEIDVSGTTDDILVSPPMTTVRFVRRNNVTVS